MLQQQSCKKATYHPSRKIGMAIFSDAFTLSMREKLITRTIQQRLDYYDNLIVSVTEFEPQWLDIFPFIDMLLCDTFVLNTSAFFYPLDQCIPRISFPNLKQLDLRDCNILNLEMIQFLDCQNLRQLDLSWNRALSMSPLMKSKWVNLVNFNLHGNLIVQFQVSRIKTNKKAIIIAPTRNFNGLDTIIDKGVLAKMQPQQAKQICKYVCNKSFDSQEQYQQPQSHLLFEAQMAYLLFFSKSLMDLIRLMY